MDFKSKAVGQELDDFEIALRQELDKKYRHILKEFSYYCI
jgi:hypothetical protein